MQIVESGGGPGFMEVEEMTGSGGDVISVLQVSGLHGGRLSPYTVLLSV